MYPTISVIIPSLNQGYFLERAIRSIISQQYSAFQLIVIDGGSVDGSLEVVKKFEKHIYFWLSESDKGQSDAINKGFKKGTGDLFCWLNADDVLFPYTLQKLSEVFRKNPDIDIITGNVVYIDKDDLIVRCVRVPKMRWFFYRFGVGYFAAPAVFFKKHLYHKVEYIDTSLRYSMDIDLWHKFRIRNARIHHIKDYLGGFRIHASSKTSAFRRKKPKAFENPETTLVRARYIPNVSRDLIRIFRLLYKFWQIGNLNYFKAWLDLQRWKGKTWQEIFCTK